VQRWRLNPVSIVRELFQAAPDTRQAKALGAFSTDPRMAVKSAKGRAGQRHSRGVGGILLTREHCNTEGMSISGDNLGSALWKRLATWLLPVST